MTVRTFGLEFLDFLGRANPYSLHKWLSPYVLEWVSVVARETAIHSMVQDHRTEENIENSTVNIILYVNLSMERYSTTNI